MDIQTLNPVLIRKLGLKALAKNLGPIGMVVFFSSLRVEWETTQQKESNG
jgi:hypothetical protein